MSKGTEEVLAEIKGLAGGGAFGSVIGRNSFQRPKPHALKLLRAVQEIYRAAKQLAASVRLAGLDAPGWEEGACARVPESCRCCAGC